MFKVFNKAPQGKAGSQGQGTKSQRHGRSGAPSFDETRRDCNASRSAHNRAFLV